VNDVAIALARHWKLIAVALDFKSAFDVVWHNGLVYKLIEAGVPEPIVRWVADFLRGRCFKLKIDGELSIEHEIHCGVPQGSPLSPLLFIFFTADMEPSKVEPDDGKRRVANGTYADDALNWAYGKSALDCSRRLQTQLDNTVKWCARWRLILHPEKCESMMFGFYNSLPSINLRLGPRRIKQVTQLTYLGLHLSPRLGWDTHLSAVSAKTRPRAGMLRGIMTRKVLPQKLGIMFHNAMSQSVMTYSSPAWSCLPKSSVDRLFETQANGLRAALDLPFDADSFGTLYLAGVKSIEEVFLDRLETYGQKCLRTSNVMSDYLRYIWKLSFDDFGRKMMQQHSPAWRIRHLSATVTQPSEPNTFVWLKFVTADDEN